MDHTEDMIEKSSDAIQELFKQVRPLILQKAGKIDFTDKNDGTPVTEIDIEVERIICKSLKQQFPELPVFGEESGYDEDNLPELCWLIDPIDGTKSFIKNTGTFTNMAVLIKGDDIAMSIVYNPTTDEMYVARKGHGAYKNNQKLTLSKTQLPKISLCKGRFVDDLDKITEILGVKNQIGPVGAGYKSAMIAEGLVAANFNLPGKGYVHDYATGMLLVEEAGGDIIPVQRDKCTYKTRSFIACHPDLSSVIRAKIQQIKELEISKAD